MILTQSVPGTKSGNIKICIVVLPLNLKNQTRLAKLNCLRIKKAQLCLTQNICSC